MMHWQLIAVQAAYDTATLGNANPCIVVAAGSQQAPVVLVQLVLSCKLRCTHPPVLHDSHCL
jgi:hypothetical protein